ncbi:LysR family transcriptional regulator [Clostridium ganghwense]|uniref:LysR family transcriptional regulator n=1 Tax=Clostridium ganghwense TaxID=312089 RepID=A0ABT4CKQ5_9CLOT|nr:LysR family transcriptional regulator [Clostridium ganghwense]MCY6369073.1 LysR family transcriptional regulator [Clostridium ganghwense]
MLGTRLLTFLTVAKIKNYTKSARILNLTQPAVSQHIKFLEEHYGVKFIKKNGRNIELTQEGEEFLEYVKELEVKEREIYKKLKNKSSVEKTYNIGATLTIGGYVLPKILGKYKEQYPNIEIILTVNNTKEILRKLLREEIDLGLVEGPFDRNKFEYKRLKEDELILAFSPKHEFSKEEYVQLEDILSGKLILREEGSGTRKYFENTLLDEGYSANDLNIYMEVGSIDAIKALVEANLGYTIISKAAIERELKLGVIKTVPIKNKRLNVVNFYREFNFVYLSGSMNNYLSDFMEFCFDSII